jgi:6-phosphogluconolactonase
MTTTPCLHAHVSVAGSGELLTLTRADTAAPWQIAQRLALSGALMPMAHSRDGCRLYVVRRSAPFALLTLRVSVQGDLSLLGECPLAGNLVQVAASPCGRWLYGASYDGHRVCRIALDEQGVATQEVFSLDTPPQAHACLPSPDGATVWASSLGGDCVLALDARSAPALTERGRLVGPPGSGPRHLAWHPSQPQLFVLNECDATLAVWQIAAAPEGPHQLLDTAALMPEGTEGAPWAADLGLSPDGATVWATERRSATLSRWHWDGARLRLQGRWAVDANPRSLSVAPDGSGVAVLSQATGMLHWLPTDTDSIAQPLHCGSNPTWVSCWAGPR